MLRALAFCGTLSLWLRGRGPAELSLGEDAVFAIYLCFLAGQLVLIKAYPSTWTRLAVRLTVATQLASVALPPLWKVAGGIFSVAFMTMVPVLLMFGLGSQDALSSTLHAAVQTVCCLVSMWHADPICATPALRHAGSIQLMGGLQAALDALLLAQPFPLSLFKEHSEHSRCVAVTCFSQLAIGLAVPVAIAAGAERRLASERQARRRRQRQQAEAEGGDLSSDAGSSRSCEVSWLARALDCSDSGGGWARGVGLLLVAALAWDGLSALAHALHAAA